MSTVCSYENCENRYRPFCDYSFFKIPNDLDLRLVWLKHCSNESALLTYRKTPNWKFYICEKHFPEIDIQRKGTRTNLSPNAIPYANGKFCKCINGFMDKRCSLAIDRATKARFQSRRQRKKLKNVETNAGSGETNIDCCPDNDEEFSIDLPSQLTAPTDITCTVSFGDGQKMKINNRWSDDIPETQRKKVKQEGSIDIC